MGRGPVNPIGDDLEGIVKRLDRAVGRLRFDDPVDVVYNPLRYAWRSHRRYLRFARPGIEALWLGMNPGPWGMSQTGVPFGEVAHVRDFLGIDEPVDRPKVEHPKRPIQGFDCQRSEVSGRRVWGWVSDRFGTPEAFFDRFFIWNDCPLAFLEESGRNRTPDRLPSTEREPLFKACDRALRDIVDLLRPKLLIGVGAHARRRLEGCFEDRLERTPGDGGLRIGTILHPSPASPAANRDWVGTVERQLAELGVELGGPA
ncbi:MAG: uracil-DNA glycosylase family protein [Planctomycetota bacterium]|nr:uracil-DNA glycosylase family protein [Planctomycetota bacterium]